MGGLPPITDAEWSRVQKALDDNAGNIYVGNSDVTAGTVAATDGALVEAGRFVVVDIDDPTDLYVIADSGAANKVFYLAV